MKLIENRASFGGQQQVWRHSASSLNCEMNVAVYLPPQTKQRACPVLYWLSGLTCTEQNFITKAGAQRYAAEHGMIVVAPDTSPRGADVPDVESYDLGQGAGFYVNATQAPWSQHYRMYDYVVDELPHLIEAHFNASQARAICGHSMGGHGALMIALRNPTRYRSVSAFAPITAPTQVPWGEKALSTYLGDDRASWLTYDSVALIKAASTKLPLFVDQGSDDEFLHKSLRLELLQQACEAMEHPLTLRMQAGYDHSYYFIASFIGEHVAYHAERCRN